MSEHFNGYMQQLDEETYQYLDHLLDQYGIGLNSITEQ